MSPSSTRRCWRSRCCSETARPNTIPWSSGMTAVWSWRSAPDPKQIVNGDALKGYDLESAWTAWPDAIPECACSAEEHRTARPTAKGHVRHRHSRTGIRRAQDDRASTSENVFPNFGAISSTGSKPPKRRRCNSGLCPSGGTRLADPDTALTAIRAARRRVAGCAADFVGRQHPIAQSGAAAERRSTAKPRLFLRRLSRRGD